MALRFSLTNGALDGRYKEYVADPESLILDAKLTKEELKAIALNTTNKSVSDLHRLGVTSLIKRDAKGAVIVQQDWVRLFSKLFGSTQDSEDVKQAITQV